VSKVYWVPCLDLPRGSTQNKSRAAPQAHALKTLWLRHERACISKQYWVCAGRTPHTPWTHKGPELSLPPCQLCTSSTLDT
jgi:hypothetical protein